MSIFNFTQFETINKGAFVKIKSLYFRSMKLFLSAGITIFFLICNVSTLVAQCNGSNSLCSKRYNEVAYLTTHNSFNAADQGFVFPNQNFGITQQLNDGVRGLMIDVYDQGGNAVVYHGLSLLGTESFQNILIEIRTFLENNPNEIVTIILECYVTSSVIESELINSGLMSYLYEKPLGVEWDILGDMISNDKRLVIFSDVNDASFEQGWYHYAWDHCVETHFSVNSINDFTNDYNRGDATNDLFIFNHFVTNSITGTGLPNDAPSVNAYPFLMSRIQQHFSEYSKFPNFVTLDFYELGNGLEVVDSLNSPWNVLSTPEMGSATEIKIYPVPASDNLTIQCNKAKGTKIEIIDQLGMVKSSFVLQKDNSTIQFNDFKGGIYFLRIDGEIIQRFIVAS